MLGRLARGRRDHIALLNGFNEAMARRIIAASDFCLMPSRFEPCGLVQMQAQRYGALPIAHATGGLADTIEDGSDRVPVHRLLGRRAREACRRALAAYGDAGLLEGMRRAAMSRRFHWSAAAEHYAAMYRHLVDRSSPERRPLSSAIPRQHDHRRRKEDLQLAA